MAILNLRPGEVRPVALSILQSFLNGSSRVFTVAAANTIFLEHFSAADLAYAYTASALVIALLGIAHGRVDKRFGLLAAGLGGAVLLAVTGASARLLLEVGVIAPAIAFALVLFAEAEWTLTNITFWSTANRVFTVRQASRLFGLISAGEVLPAIAGGLAIPSLVEHLGVANLLWISAGAHVLAALNLWAMGWVFRARFRDFRDGAPVSPNEPATKPRAQLREILRDRYLILIAAELALNTFAFFLVDNTFYHAAESRFTSREQLAGFLGHFFLALGIASLLFKLFLAGRWRTWFGLRTALLTTPACVAVLCALVALGPFFHLGDRAVVLGSVLILKLIERVLVEGVNIPAFYALLQPLAARTRSRVQSALETQFQQIATAVAGLVIVVLTHQLALGPPGLAAATLVVIGLWLAVAWFLGGAYVAAIRGALEHHRLDPSALPLHEAARSDVLEKGLRSADPAHALYSFHLLEAMRHPRLDELAVELLEHPHAQLVKEACALIEKNKTAKAIPVLRARIAETTLPPEVRAGMLRALAAAGGAESKSFLVEHLGHSDARLRAGAIVGLYRYCGEEGEQAAKPVLLEMLRAARAEDRVAEVEVRRAAIRAAGELSVAGLWSFVIDSLGDRALRADATQVLIAGGRRVLGPLRDAYRKEGEDWHVRRKILEIIGRIGGSDAQKILLDLLRSADRELQTDVLAALDRSDYRPSEANAALFRVLGDSELANYRDILLARRDVAGLPGSDLLCDAFDGELEKCSERILLLLGLRFDRAVISEIRAHLASGEPERTALALELLDTTLPPQEAARVLPIFEALSPEEQALRLEEGTDSALREGAACVEQLIDGKMPWRTSWLLTCAIGARASPRGAEDSVKISEGRAVEALDRVRLLRRIDLFAGVHGEQLSALAHRARIRGLGREDVLLERGTENASLYIVTDGRLSVEWQDGAWAELGAEQSIGELDLLERTPSRAQAIAAVDAHVLEVRKEDLDDLFADDVDVAWHIITTLCRRHQTQRPLRKPIGGSKPTRPALSLPLSEETGPSEQRPVHSTMQRVLSLKKNELFAGLEDGILAAIAETAEEQFPEDKEQVFAAGDEGTSMYILLEGRMCVHLGRQTIAVLDAPNIFGELAAIVPAPRTASVTSVGHAHVLILQRSTVYELVRTQREMIGLLQKLLLRRLRAPLPLDSISAVLR